MSQIRIINNNIDKALARIKSDISDILFEEAVIIGGDAQSRAPIETGALRDSGQIIKNKEKITLSMGGALTTTDRGFDYAVKQHEDLTLSHSGPDHGKVDGGEAKFLENALNARETVLISRLKEGLR